MGRQDIDVVVVGAGVIGLTAGVVLAEAGARVRILTAEEPPATTSAVAGALTGILLPGPLPELERWGKITTDEFTALAADPSTGVRLTSGLALSRMEGEFPSSCTALPGFTTLRPEELAEGFHVGFRATVPLVEMPRYLGYLTDRYRASGGELTVHRLRSLTEAAEQARTVVNCAGAGARDLVSDNSVRPGWGQHVVVENPGVTEFFFEHTMAAEWASFMPHGEHVVLGGVAVPDQWDRATDPDVATGILRRCAAVEPLLAGARVLEHRVGLRPDRPAVRLEAEPLGDGRRVHCYGHGGMGVSLSWGCAREVAALVAGS